MRTGKSPAEYRFDDSRNLFRATIVGNLLLAAFMAAPNLADFPYSIHVQLSFYTACLAFVVHRLYDWNKNKFHRVNQNFLASKTNANSVRQNFLASKTINPKMLIHG